MTYTFNRPAFPATRMRRIRKNDQLRAMIRETHFKHRSLDLSCICFTRTKSNPRYPKHAEHSAFIGRLITQKSRAFNAARCI